MQCISPTWKGVVIFHALPVRLHKNTITYVRNKHYPWVNTFIPYVDIVVFRKLAVLAMYTSTGKM